MSQVKWTKPMSAKPAKSWNVGQPPYDVESWTFTVTSKFGGNAIVYSYTPPNWLTHDQGINQLLSLGTTYGANYVVCGVMKKLYQYAGSGTTYCTYDGGVSYQTGPMVPGPPVPVPSAPVPFYTRQSVFPFIEDPFVPFFGGSTTRVTWSSQTRGGGGFLPIFGPRRRVQWIGQADLHDTVTYKACYNGCVQKCTEKNQNNPAAFDACIVGCDPTCLMQAALEGGTPTNVGALQAKINAALGGQGICKINPDGKLGPTTCDAAIYVSSYIDPSVAVPQQCGSIDQTQSTFNPNCKTGAPITPPGCKNDHPDCGNAGFICVEGDCVPGCRTDADCGPNFRCVNGQCAPVTSSSSSSTGMGGIFALAAAGLALGAAAFFGKAPKLPKSAAGRLQQNPRRRKRRKYAGN